MVVFAGEPGVGKSFLMYSMSVCIASGLPFLGMQTTQGPVLYFDEENAKPDLSQYLRWTWRGIGEPPVSQLKENLIIEHFSLIQHGHTRFEYMAKRAAEIKPLLIVIDTASPVCNIQDENDNGEGGRAINKLRAVKASAGEQAGMIVLKHAKIITDPNLHVRTIRGAKVWLGALDGVFYHTISAGQPRKDGLRSSVVEQDKIRAFWTQERYPHQPRMDRG
jgi:hypothetical protein